MFAVYCQYCQHSDHRERLISTATCSPNLCTELWERNCNSASSYASLFVISMGKKVCLFQFRDEFYQARVHFWKLMAHVQYRHKHKFLQPGVNNKMDCLYTNIITEVVKNSENAIPWCSVVTCGNVEEHRKAYSPWLTFSMANEEE